MPHRRYREISYLDSNEMELKAKQTEIDVV